MPRALTYPWWTPWPGIGPAADVLGDITGLRVVELGCGSGDNAAAFAKAGADVTGVDTNPTKIEQALQRWGDQPGLGFVHADATGYLTLSRDHPDVAVSIFGALSFSPAPPLLDPSALASHPPAGSPSAPEFPQPVPTAPDDWAALLETHRFKIGRSHY
ncbi:MAG: class I SAM-dependent methyltransferase [Acidimicrobiales bacterium]